MIAFRRTQARLRSAAIAVSCALVVACSSGGSGDAFVPDGCSIVEQNRFVVDLMNDIYFWSDEVPANIDPASFSSPEATMNAMLFLPLDRFSGIRDKEANDAFFSDSQFIGVGIGLQTFPNDTVFVTQAFSDGPAAAVGIERGYEIVSVNGRTVEEILASGDSIGDAFGPDEVGVAVDLVYRDIAGTEMQATIFKDLVTIETVTTTAIFDVGGRTTGYLAFRNFVEPSFDALSAAFAEFQTNRVEDLILDVRYNGGGLLSVAEFLGNLIGGTNTATQVFSQRVHNPANAFRNVTTLFADVTDALNLERVTIITSAGTASASELVINALVPFAEVKLVGDSTFGKPVGAYQFEFCDKVAVPTAFTNFNANGEGDYFDGFAPDCAAEDDLTRALGDPLETMLAEALYLLENGQCSASAAAAKSANAAARAKRLSLGRRATEFRQLVNGY